MRIPEVREELEELADKHGIPRLQELADQLRRRSPVRRAEPTAKALTNEQKAEIRKRYRVSPEPLQNIAIRYGVNNGRISEVLRGFRQ